MEYRTFKIFRDGIRILKFLRMKTELELYFRGEKEYFNQKIIFRSS